MASGFPCSGILQRKTALKIIQPARGALLSNARHANLRLFGLASLRHPMKPRSPILISFLFLAWLVCAGLNANPLEGARPTCTPVGESSPQDSPKRVCCGVSSLADGLGESLDLASQRSALKISDRENEAAVGDAGSGCNCCCECTDDHDGEPPLEQPSTAPSNYRGPSPLNAWSAVSMGLIHRLYHCSGEHQNRPRLASSDPLPRMRSFRVLHCAFQI